MWVRFTAALVLVAIAGGTATLAQRGWRGGWYRMPPKFPVESPTHRAFTFSRILYDSDRREAGGQGWHTDYPSADQNLMIRLSEMTTTDVGFDRYDGFLWVDDFWGPWAWEQWLGEISRVLPPATYPIFDIPEDHPIRRIQYEVEEIPQIPSIQHWRRSGGYTTSERGRRSEEVHFRGIADDSGRLLVLMSHNTDIADGWEREGEDYEFFYRFSVRAYAVGINTVIHAMTN